MIKLKEILTEATTTNRICVSTKELFHRSVPKKQTIGFKPIGLWYAFGKDWVEYLQKVLKEPVGQYVYKFDVSKCNMLYLNSEYRIHEFTTRYTTAKGLLDWNQVAQKYEGIEFNPYIKELAKVYEWYDTIALPSGCIWDSKKLKMELVNADGVHQ